MNIKTVKSNVINGIFRKIVFNRDLLSYNSKDIVYRESKLKENEKRIRELETIKSHAVMYNRRGHL